jgi:hypothetical protein
MFMSKDKLYGFKRWGKWWNQRTGEFGSLSRASFYAEDEANTVKDSIAAANGAKMTVVSLSELHDELEIRAELLSSSSQSKV